MFKSLFKSAKGPRTDARNHHGSAAYQMDSREALAQMALTGCFANTFYVSAQEQLTEVLKHAAECDPMFVAKVAIVARERGFMKDMPVVLLAHLSTRGPSGRVAMKRAFPRVVTNGTMLRKFVQVMRSGMIGRRSLGTAPKKLVQTWLQGRTPFQLFRDSVGNDPSLADVIKMVHPRPVSAEQRAMFAYVIGKPYDVSKLPEQVQAFEAYKRGETKVVPKVPSRMLQGLSLGTDAWKVIAKNARWHETRMNLNAFARHGVFEDPAMVALLAKRLSDPKEISGAKAFPYQLLSAWKMTGNVPMKLQNALQDAMEHAVANVPAIDGRVVVCPDVSGSMGSPVTGYRAGATSVVRCVDVAGLVAAAMLRKNPEARVLPFENAVREVRVNPRDSVMSLAKTFAMNGGGTNCSAPLALLNKERAKVDLVLFVSDNESWIDSKGCAGWGRSTAMMDEWKKLKKRNPHAKLVCIDLTPNTRKQTISDRDILNVGGFSDAVFTTIRTFLEGGTGWAEQIEKVKFAET